jgi:hypothetical protein
MTDPQLLIAGILLIGSMTVVAIIEHYAGNK